MYSAISHQNNDLESDDTSDAVKVILLHITPLALAFNALWISNGTTTHLPNSNDLSSFLS
jgi:hypothetical protein